MNDVMIIDDNEFYAKYIEKVLQRENVRSVKYLNPVAAIDDIMEEKIKPKAIFLDVMMPIINGYEFLEQFQQKEKLKKTPIIVCTASVIPAEVEEKYKNLNIRFMTKPISTDSVLSSYKKMVN